jgi:acylglycerol lipase
MPVLDVNKLREEFEAPHELVTASDGKTLFLRHWVSSSRTDLAILIFHGITAYSEPYGKLIAEEVERAGFNVFGMDLRGHGLSDGIRGDYPSADRLSKDLCETLKFLRGKYSKVVVLGHSLGVLSAIVAVNNCRENIDGLILLSAGRKIRPGAYPKPTTSAALKTIVAITLFPKRPLIEYSRKGMVGRNNPWFNFKYSARFYSVLYGTSAWSVVRMFTKNEIRSPNMVINNSLDIPVLVGVGDQDEIFSVDSAKAFFDEIQARRKEFVVIPGAGHASFPEGAWVQLTSWMKKSYPEL